MFRVTLIALLAAAVCFPQDWNQWRGPRRDGFANFSAPAAWPREPNKAWVVEAGEGYSSPVASATHAFQLSREGSAEVIRAVDLSTGAVQWTQRYSVPFNKSQYALRMASGPFATPLLENGKLYTLGVTAILSCFDARTGKLVWRNDESRRVDTGKLFTGTAASPLFAAGSLIVYIGDDSRGTLAALDPDTGALRWKWEEDGPGYASPVVAGLGGMLQLVALSDKRLVGIDLATGRLLWSYPFPDQWNENIATPAVAGNRVVISGVRNGTVALDVTRMADRWNVERAWHNNQAAMYMSSPILHGAHLYGFSAKQKGHYFCQELATGRILWSTEGRGGEHASLISTGDLLVGLTTEGELSVMRRSPDKYHLVARYKVAESGVWSHLTPVNGGLLVKDATSLVLWKFASAKSASGKAE